MNMRFENIGLWKGAFRVCYDRSSELVKGGQLVQYIPPHGRPMGDTQKRPATVVF